MLKVITLALALYFIVALLTRGKRKEGKLSEHADRAVLALATTTRYVLIAILIFVVGAAAAFLFGLI